MTIELNIWVALFAAGLVISLYMQILFLGFRRGNSSHFNNILIILFVMSLILFDELVQESEIIHPYPFAIDLTTAADLLIWPFLLFYFQAITNKRNRYHPADLLYLVPFLAGIVWQFSFTYLSELIPVWLFVLFKFIVSISFLIYILKILSTPKGQPGFFYKSRKVATLGYLSMLVKIVAAIVVVMYLSFFLSYTNLDIPLVTDKIGSLLIVCCVYLLGFIAFKNPSLMDSQAYSQPIVKFFRGQESQYVKQMISMVEEEKLFKKEDLNISELSRLMSLTK